MSKKEIEFIYEIPTRHSKEELRAGIDELRKRQQQTDQILAALTSGDGVETILEQLQNHAKLEHITAQLCPAEGVRHVNYRATTLQGVLGGQPEDSC